MDKVLIVMVAFLVGAAMGEVSNEYKDFIVQKHNEYRHDQGGSNINKMEWNATLGEIADRWLANCNFEHEMKGFGENLYYETAPDTDDFTGLMQNAFTSWYNEIDDYRRMGQVSCGPSASCHYTQMVWYKTKQIGCAHRVCSNFIAFGSRPEGKIFYFGCWYFPRGNWGNEKPFEVGDPCKDCLEGQQCEDGLCVGEGKEKCENNDKNCIMWANSGECQRNKSWMEKNCRQACKLCED